MGTKSYDNALDLITFSRASRGTALRKISYGSELAPNLDTWSKVGDAATTLTYNSGDGSLDVDAATVLDGASVNAGLTTGKVYLFEADITLGTSTNARVTVGPGYTVFSNITASGVASLIFVAQDQYIRIDSYVSTGTFTVNSVSVKEVLFDQPDGTLTLFNHPDNIPRIDYNSDGTVKGLLIEEARTNLEEYSNDFSSGGWAKNGTVTLTAGEYDGPLGVNSGTKVDAGTALDGLYEFLPSVASGSSLAVSAWFKYVSGDTELRFALEGAAFSTGRSGVVVDISDGTISGTTGSVTPDTFDVIDYGNGWYRAFFTTTTTATGIYALVVYTENSAGVFGLSGVQIEAGAFPTSYIPTSGASATREPDLASIPTSAFGYNTKTGTVVVDYANIQYSPELTATFLVDIGSSSSGENRTIIFADAAASQIRAFSIANSVVAANLLAKAADAPVSGKAAFAFADNDFATVGDGDVVRTDTSGSFSTPSTARNTLKIGGAANGVASNISGHIKSIQYYPRRLTNAQLQELTA